MNKQPWEELATDFTKDIRKDVQGVVNEIVYGQRTAVVTVAKPFCSPARNIITGALQPYGVKIHRINERCEYVSIQGFIRKWRIEVKTFENFKYLNPMGIAMWLPKAVIAEVIVNEAAAGWAEYLLLNTGKLFVPGEYVNPKNAQWAARRGYKMPVAWNSDEPWLERSCAEGINTWRTTIRNLRRISPTRRK